MWQLTFEKKPINRIYAIFKNSNNDKQMEFDLNLVRDHSTPKEKSIVWANWIKSINADFTLILGLNPDYKQPLHEATFESLYPSWLWIENQAGAQNMCDIIAGYRWHTDPSKMILRLDNREDPPDPTLSEEDVPFLKDANKGFLTFFKDILYNTQFRETVRKDFEECWKLLVDYFNQDPDDIPRWLW